MIITEQVNGPSTTAYNKRHLFCNNVKYFSSCISISHFLLDVAAPDPGPHPATTEALTRTAPPPELS